MEKSRPLFYCHVEPSRDISTDCNTVVLRLRGFLRTGKPLVLREGEMTRYDVMSTGKHVVFGTETSRPLYKNNLCKKYKIVKDMLISLLKNKIVII